MDLSKARWVDNPNNPLIEPPRPHWLIADPAVLPPDQTPDGKWEMIANSVGFLNRYTSGDGIAWEKQGAALFRGMRANLFRDNDTYYLLYELHVRPWLSGIFFRTTKDFQDWSDQKPLLMASDSRYDGRVIRFLGNPCLVKTGGEYRLYFSSGWIWLWDCLYFEPRNIGVATSESIEGPYSRRPGALIEPQRDHTYLNFGAGCMKIMPDDDGWWIFNNGIYKEPSGKSRSAIRLMRSRDGFEFTEVHSEPIITPEPGGWKNAFVYAFDPVLYNGELRLYYNCRDGWLKGSERIGFATAEFE